MTNVVDVMIVEDSVTMAEGYADLLRARGRSSRIFRDGAAAIDWLQTHQPKAALLDKQLLEQDGSRQRVQGMGVFKFIRTHWPTVPCIIATSFPDGKEDFQFGALSAVRYFHKCDALPTTIVDAVCDAIKEAALKARWDQMVLSAEATCYGIVAALATKEIREDIQSLNLLCMEGRRESHGDQKDLFHKLERLGQRMNRSFDQMGILNPRFSGLLDEAVAVMGQSRGRRKSAMVVCTQVAIGNEIASLTEIARSGLAVPSQIVHVHGGETVVEMDDFLGRQLFYLALRVSLERSQGRNHPRVSVRAELIEGSQPHVKITFSDNGGGFAQFHHDSPEDEAEGVLGQSWLTAQFTAIRCLAQLHGGEATFDNQSDDGGAGLATCIHLPKMENRV